MVQRRFFGITFIIFIIVTASRPIDSREWINYRGVESYFKLGGWNQNIFWLTAKGVGKRHCILTLFWAGGGHYGPDDRERPRCFRRVRATTTKIHDFVSVYVWMVPWKSFLGFVFKIFEKRKKFFLTISTSKGPPFGKKIENIKKFFFLEKIILFLFEFVLYMF